MKNRFTQDNSSTSHLKMMPLRWGGHIGGSHIEREIHNKKRWLRCYGQFLMTVIQYNIDFSIQPCTQDDIYYMPKMKRGE